MANLNRVILVGKLASDPEVRASNDGVSLSKFKLVVNGYGDQAPDMIDVIAWDKIAETASGLKAGRMVLVDGRIQVKTYEDQLGQKKWATEVVAGVLNILDKSAVAQKETVPASSEYDDVEELPEGDLPF